ncbi:MAG: hypothetical protein K5765_00580 [Clostridia bacterium]|nr:hypothetical protein [Clostridia bacterium]
MKVFNSVIGKILGVLLCIIIGMVLAVGGEALAVYLLGTRQNGVKTVSDLYNQYTPESMPKLNLSDEVKAMSVVNWGKSIINAATSSEGKIGDIEELLGTSIISTKLNELLGVPVDAVKESSLSGIGETITENLTLGAVADKFNVTLPDLPIFKDQEFLDKPIAHAFEDLTEYELNKFIDINEESNVVIKSIADLKISELGTDALTEKVNSLKLNEVMEVGEESHPVLKALQDLTIGELSGSGVEEKIGTLFLDEILTISEESNQTMKSIQYATTKSQIVSIRISDTTAYIGDRRVEGYEYVTYGDEKYVYYIKNGEKVYESGGTHAQFLKTRDYKNYYRPMIGIEDKVGTITIGELVEIDENDTLLYSLRNSTIDSLPEDVNRLFLGEILTITNETTKTLQALKYSTLKTVETLIDKAGTTIEYGQEHEKPGYIYLINDGKYYVGIINNLGALDEALNEQSIQCYRAYETKLFDNIYYPMVSIDETTKNLLIDELMDVGTSPSKIMDTIKDAALESNIVELNKTNFDDSTTTYMATAEYDASLELTKYAGNYLYSTRGIAYICKVDKDGNRIISDGKYTAYRTKIYKGKYYPIKGVSDQIDELTLGDAIEIDSSSPTILKTLEGTKINELGNAIAELFIDEITTIDSGSPTVLQTLKYSTLEDQKEHLTYSTSNFVVYPGPLAVAPGYDYYVYNDKVYAIDAGTILTNSTAYDFFKTKEYKSMIRPLAGMGTKLDTLKLNDVFSESELSQGILSLVDPNTRISQISTVVADAVQKSTVSVLQGKGVISEVEVSPSIDKDIKSFIFNSTLTDMVQGLVNFAANPVTYMAPNPPTINDDQIKPVKKDISGTYSSLTAFLGATAQYGTAYLTDNVTVNIDSTLDSDYYDSDENCYYIPVMNFDSASGYTLTFNNGTVKLAVYDTDDLDNLTGISNNQYAYVYYKSTVYIPTAISGGNITIEAK